MNRLFLLADEFVVGLLAQMEFRLFQPPMPVVHASVGFPSSCSPKPALPTDHSLSHPARHSFWTASSLHLAVGVAFVLLSGCAPSDRPKIVPAASGIQLTVDPSAGLSMAPPPPAVSFNSGLQGQTMLCDNVGASPTWLMYGPKGRVDEISSSGAVRTGLRFEVGHFGQDVHRVGFQFVANGAPSMFKADRSDGNASELLNAASNGAPAMRCFRRLQSEFMWTDSHLLDAASKLVGSWRCSGMFNDLTITNDGAFVAGGQSGQLFVWSTSNQPRLNFFWSGPSKNGQHMFDRSLETVASFAQLDQSKWMIEHAGPGGQKLTTSCARSPG